MWIFRPIKKRRQSKAAEKFQEDELWVSEPFSAEKINRSNGTSKFHRYNLEQQRSTFGAKNPAVLVGFRERVVTDKYANPIKSTGYLTNFGPKEVY